MKAGTSEILFNALESTKRSYCDIKQIKQNINVTIICDNTGKYLEAIKDISR